MEKEKAVVVIGLGKSGESAAKLAFLQGYQVWVFDESQALVKNFCALYSKAFPVQEEHFLDKFWEFAIVSPGISLQKSFIKHLVRRKIPLKSEVEFGLEKLQIPAIAVTGTNGKSTVVYLASLLLKEAKIDAVCCGNYGLPICEIALKDKLPSLLVVELSSYQLELMQKPYFERGCILNIEENHLDRHGSLDEYAKCKLKLAALLLEETSCFFLQEEIENRFSSLLNGVVYQTYKGCAGTSASIEGKRYPFIGNFLKDEVKKENLLAALLLTVPYGVSPKHSNQVQETFAPLPHRFQQIAEVKGIKIFNDSKSTNPASTRAALQSVDPKVIWLVGGSREKKSDFSTLKDLVKQKVRYTIALGEEKERIAAAFSSICPVEIKNNFEDAVFRALFLAKRGDSVLLSPACASFDMFKNYQDRGEQFECLVAKWKEMGHG